MAKLQKNGINKTTALFVVLLSLLLIITIVESRAVTHIGKVKAASSPSCESVFGVSEGDTCAEIAETFNLSDGEFGAINPNLNCDALFVGQWLCVAGTA